MRARVIFRLQNRGGVVPFHHQHVLAQLIKGLIVKENKKEFLHYKLYNFSGLKGQTKISRKGLHFFSSKITLVLSSPSKDFIDHFLTTLFGHDEIEVGNLRLVPESVELEEPLLEKSPVKIVCISPVVLVKPVFGDEKGKRF
ncbi:MAG: CRISPR-associated protein Cas6, partial [Cyclobacteriaceae bacterium]|nr:CRISPR-associated protein Cas6 [Cyclobacteriaceae bacterium]